MPCQIIHWQGIQINFVTICTKPIFIKVVLAKLEQERASTLYLNHCQENRQFLQQPNASVSLKDVLLL